MNRILMYALFFMAMVGGTVFFAWRKSKKVQPDSPDLMGWSALPSDFHAFFDTFHSDSAFQMAHIRFPLAGLPAFADSSQNGTFFWQANEWELHRATFLNDTGFVRAYAMLDQNFITETIKQKQPPYSGFMRRFAKTDGKNWELIYYVNANRF